MGVRNRIKELRWVRAGDVRANPRNWRSHPSFQRQALRAVLDEVGFADALVARELSDGSLELIDGHLRAEMLPDDKLPVLVLDVDEAEADKLLASLDPLASLARCNTAAVTALVSRLHSESAELQSVFDHLASGEPLAQLAATPEETAPISPPDTQVVNSFQIIVECRDEAYQRCLYERLAGEGYSCRVLTL